MMFNIIEITLKSYLIQLKLINVLIILFSLYLFCFTDLFSKLIWFNIIFVLIVFSNGHIKIKIIKSILETDDS